MKYSASGDGGQFKVHLELIPDQYAWIEGLDEGGPWAQRDYRDERPHGLEIVAALATESGVDGDERSGWIAWARLDLPKPSGDTPAQAGAADWQLAAVEYDTPGASVAEGDIEVPMVPLHLDAGGGATARHEHRARR